MSNKSAAIYFEDASTFNALNSSNSKQFAHFSNDEVWWDYKTNPSPRKSDYAKEELLLRQNGMLSQLAYSMYSQNKVIGEYCDFFEQARYIALKAYDSFDYHKNVCINTYVWNNVQYSLNTMCDQNALIRKQSSKRGWVSYFSGYYDSNLEKKQAFETKHAKVFADPVRLAEVKRQCGVLKADIISYEGFITNDEGNVVERDFSNLYDSSEESSIIEPIDWSNTIDELTDVQKMVYKLVFENQLKPKEIVEITNMKLSQVKKEINAIKGLFHKRFPELVPEEIEENDSSIDVEEEGLSYSLAS